MNHHPIFEKFSRRAPFDDEKHHHNFMGAKVAHAFEGDIFDGIKASGRSSRHDGDYPFRQSEDYFEWIDLLTAIDSAKEQFIMIEVGAGYGRWIANGAAAARQRKITTRFVGLEASQARFDMMVANCHDNGMDAELRRQACTVDGQPALIPVNDSYGASVFRHAQLEAVGAERVGVKAANGTVSYFENVPGIRLSDLLTGPVDFLDVDIQGAELEVVPASIEAINKHVRLIHIGTHSAPIDATLTALFRAHGWTQRFLFAHNQTNETPYGRFQFIDGIQSWSNPAL